MASIPLSYQRGLRLIRPEKNVLIAKVRVNNFLTMNYQFKNKLRHCRSIYPISTFNVGLLNQPIKSPTIILVKEQSMA